MTRSHKFNDRDHSGNVEQPPNDYLPRYFAKSGHSDADPTKTKKNGGGKGNWGREGDELEDYNYNFTNPRRRSNSSSHATHLSNFKTKFEVIEPEPVFNEEIHGAQAVNYDEDGEPLEKRSTTGSSGESSIAENVDEENAKKM